MIIKATRKDTRRIALMHMNELKSGFLSSLGPYFLTSIYNKVIKKGVLLVYLNGHAIEGFVSFCPNTKKLMIYFAISNPFNLLWLTITCIRNPSILKKSLETFTAPFRSSRKKLTKADLPSAELLSIAVDSSIQTKGIGAQLLNTLEQELLKTGIKEYKVIAGTNLVSANNFYLKNGFVKVMNINIHGHELSNVYIKKL